MTNEKENRLKVMRVLMDDKDILAGGVNEKKERYYMEKYDMTLEEIVNIELAIHGVYFNRKIKFDD